MADDLQTRSMLILLLATCEQTLVTLQAAHNEVDSELIADLNRMVERTRAELESLQPKPGS